MLILTRTSIEQRARDHLAAVASALDTTGIEFWHVPDPARPSRTRIGTFAAPGAVLAAMGGLGPQWTIEMWDIDRREWLRAEVPGPTRAPGALRMYTTAWDPGSHRRIAVIACVEVDSWVVEGAQMVATLPHIRGTTIPAGDPPTGPGDVRGQVLWTWESLAVIEPTLLAEPVDVVFTWVDSRDPQYWAARSPWLASPDADDPYSRGQARTRSMDELRYAMRSVDSYAPWVNRVWLLTDGQRPDWLDDTAVTTVDHREVLAGHVELPTFNSHAIESGLHRIDGLAEHFIYMNDDTMLGRRAAPTDFFTPAGHIVFQPSGEFLPAGPAPSDETAPGVAGRNVRTLIERDFARTITHKLRHTPHPLRRSLMAEVAQRYRDQWMVTGTNRFRAGSDVAPVQLALWYALLTGRAVTSSPPYAYVDLTATRSSLELQEAASLLRRSAFFSVNMSDDPVLGWHELEAATTALLESLFPFASRFER